MLYWSLLTLTVGVTVTAGFQYCYECSSKSALCRNFVYDGHYLTKTPCKSLCFYRNEDNRVYRGCFDGWLGGIVRSDYVGCRTQIYLGSQVEWCFCNATTESADSSKSDPCNGAHRDVIALQGKLPYEETAKGSSGKGENEGNLRTHSKYSLPGRRAPEGKTFRSAVMMSSNDKGYTVRGDPGGRYEDVSQAGSGNKAHVTQKVIECYACHDSSPYCQERVTKPQFLTSSRCRTKCFIRRESNKTYRGCFDGWVSTQVHHDYTGCRTQYYMGRAVRWCFCQHSLCNGAGMDDQAMTRPEGRKTVSTSVRDRAGYDAEVLQTDTSRSHRYRPTYTSQDRSAGMRTIVGMCRGHYDGIYADPYDCTRFVHCFNGFTYRRLCPPGTVWNNKTKNCDFPHNTAISICIPRQYTPVYSMPDSSSESQAKPPG